MSSVAFRDRTIGYQTLGAETLSQHPMSANPLLSLEAMSVSKSITMLGAMQFKHQKKLIIDVGLAY